MTDQTGSGGTAQSSGGANENEGSQGDSQKPVAYESYKKVLDEKKRTSGENAELKKRLEEFERKEKEITEKTLSEQNNYKELLKLREKEKADVEKKLNGLQSTLNNGLKRRAVLDALSGAVEDQYLGLLNLDAVAIDPETGKPDEASVNAVAREFEKKYPLVLQKKTGGVLPGDAAKGGAAMGFEAEIKTVKNQQEFDAVMRKYGKA